MEMKTWTLPFIICMTLSKICNLSRPRLFHLQMRSLRIQGGADCNVHNRAPGRESISVSVVCISTNSKAHLIRGTLDGQGPRSQQRAVLSQISFAGMRKNSCCPDGSQMFAIFHGFSFEKSTEMSP